MTLALPDGMRLGLVARSALVLLPLLLCVGRLHGQRAATPQGVTQEVNRCLSLVRVASSRRRNAQGPCGRQRSRAEAPTDGSKDYLAARSPARRSA